MTQPKIPIYYATTRRPGAARPYILAAAVGLVAGLISVAFAVLRR